MKYSKLLLLSFWVLAFMLNACERGGRFVTSSSEVSSEITNAETADSDQPDADIEGSAIEDIDENAEESDLDSVADTNEESATDDTAESEESTTDDTAESEESATDDTAESEETPIPVDNDGDGQTSDDGDCDDTDSSIYLNATEVCDGIDNDCDGEIDEDLEIAPYYLDEDGDGFGVQESTTEDCALPNGYATRFGDCDDTDSEVPSIFVNQSGFLDSESTIEAYTTIASAVDASVDGDCITVDEGNYSENIAIEDKVLSLMATGNVENTVVSGEQLGSVFDIDLTHVTNSELTFRIKGFTIKNGRTDDDGGGINFYKGNAVEISNNIFLNNYSGDLGGGLSLLAISNATISNNTFSENEGYFGGGVFSSNSSVIFTNNTFSENLAGYLGAGLALYLNSSLEATVSENTFSKNNAQNRGAGLYISNSTNGALEISNNEFLDNSAESSGGAIHFQGLGNDHVIRNNSFIRNDSPGQGSALTFVLIDGINLFNNYFYANGTDDSYSTVYFYSDLETAESKGYIANNIFFYNNGGNSGDLYVSANFIKKFNVINNIFSNSLSCGIAVQEPSDSSAEESIVKSNIFYENQEQHFCNGYTYEADNTLDQTPSFNLQELDEDLDGNLDISVDENENDIPDALETNDFGALYFDLIEGSVGEGTGDTDIDNDGTYDASFSTTDIGVYGGFYGSNW